MAVGSGSFGKLVTVCFVDMESLLEVRLFELNLENHEEIRAE